MIEAEKVCKSVPKAGEIWKVYKRVLIVEKVCKIMTGAEIVS
jgi:hypothetical protein